MSEKLDRHYWENRYQTEDTPWSLGSPSPPICHYIDQHTDRSARVLIPGAGDSSDAAYLHDCGYRDITICDISPSAIERSKALMSGKDGISYLTGDFFCLQGQFDLILEQTFFCAIDPALRPAYVDKMGDLLAEGGTLAGLLFASEFGKEGPPFGGNIDEYRSLFGNKLHIHSIDMCYNSVAPRQGNELFFICKKLASM